MVSFLGTSGDCDSEPLYIHFDFDGYEAHYMGPLAKNFKFIYDRMIPAGKTTFFFTANKMQTNSLVYPFYDDYNNSMIRVSSFLSIS